MLTPNLAEAQVLVGGSIGTLAEQADAARALGELGPRLAVVKGGHAVAVADAGDEAVDVVWDGTDLWDLRAPRVNTAHTHGTGCTFAAATGPDWHGARRSDKRWARRRPLCAGP